MKEKIIQIIGFDMEPERASLKANDLIILFNQRLLKAAQETDTRTELINKIFIKIMKANYTICTGQLLTVTTKPDLFGGNAVKLTLGGLQVQLGFLRGLMRPEDFNDLEYYINEVSEAN